MEIKKEKKKEEREGLSEAYRLLGIIKKDEVRRENMRDERINGTRTPGNRKRK